MSVTWHDLSNGTVVQEQVGPEVPLHAFGFHDVSHPVGGILRTLREDLSPTPRQRETRRTTRDGRDHHLLTKLRDERFLSALFGALLFPGEIAELLRKKRASGNSDLRILLQFSAECETDISWLPWELAALPVQNEYPSQFTILGTCPMVGLLRAPAPKSEESHTASLPQVDRVVVVHGGNSFVDGSYELTNSTVRGAVERCERVLEEVVTPQTRLPAIRVPLEDLLSSNCLEKEIDHTSFVVVVEHGDDLPGAEEIRASSIARAGMVLLASCSGGQDDPAHSSVAADLALDVPLVVGFDGQTDSFLVEGLLRNLLHHLYDPFPAVRDFRRSISEGNRFAASYVRLYGSSVEIAVGRRFVDLFDRGDKAGGAKLKNLRDAKKPEHGEFFRRALAESAVRDWATGSTDNVLWIVGDAGTGKSSFLLSLIETYLAESGGQRSGTDGELGALPVGPPLLTHVLTQDSRPGDLLKDFDEQLRAYVPALQDGPTAREPVQRDTGLIKALDGADIQESKAWCDEVFTAVASRFGTATILIDGFDEALKDTQRLLTQDVSPHANKLRIAITSRPLSSTDSGEYLELAKAYEGKTDALAWVLDHIDNQIEDPSTKEQRKEEAIAQAEALGNNFLIARSVRSSVSDDPTEELLVPTSLGEAFTVELQRVKRASDRHGVPVERAIELLSIARDITLDRPTLRALLGRHGLKGDALTVAEQALEPWAGTGSSLQLFHSEFATFIRDVACRELGNSQWWDSSAPLAGTAEDFGLFDEDALDQFRRLPFKVGLARFRESVHESARSARLEARHLAVVIDLEQAIAGSFGRDWPDFWNQVQVESDYLRRSAAYHLHRALGGVDKKTEPLASERFTELCGDVEFFSHRMAYDGPESLLADLMLAAERGIEEVELFDRRAEA